MNGWFAPGHLELLGGPLDGTRLVCALERGTTCTVSGGGERISVRAGDTGEVVDITPGTSDELPQGHWGLTLRGVTARLQADFGPLRPSRLVVTTDLPPADALGGASALVVACAMALAEHNELPRHPLWREALADQVQLAGYLASIEQHTSFGPLEGATAAAGRGASPAHLAMLCSSPGELAMVSLDPPRLAGRVALPEGYCFVVAAAGPGSAPVPHLGGESGAATGQGDDWVAEAFEALHEDDLGRFEHSVARARSDAQPGLAAPASATESLVQRATLFGARAASTSGPSGTVWALVRTDGADDFAVRWLADHGARFPKQDGQSTTLVTRPGGPAHAL